MNRAFNYFFPFPDTNDVVGFRILDVENEDEGRKVLDNFVEQRSFCLKNGLDPSSVIPLKPILISKVMGGENDGTAYALLKLLSEGEANFWKECHEKFIAKSTESHRSASPEVAPTETPGIERDHTGL
jgi:hypothetical protein